MTSAFERERFRIWFFELKAWAGVLAVWPAVLCGTSALRACLGDWPDGGAIQVAVDLRRTVVAPLGVVVHRKADLADHAQWRLSPPRSPLETAVLDVASNERRELDSVAVLAAAVGSRRTTAERLSAALSSRARTRRSAVSFVKQAA